MDAGEHTVRVDIRTGRVAGRIRVPVQAAAADGLWSCTVRLEDGPGRLVRLDPQTLAVTTRVRLPRCPAVLAAEAGAVWALDGSGRLVGAFTLARNTEGLLAAGHGSLWLAALGSGELLRLDPARR